VGFYLTQDRVNNLLFPANQGSSSTSLSDDVTGGVLRYRRDVGEVSTVGGLVTARSGKDYHNWVYGGDVFLRLSETNTIEAQYLRSSTEYPEGIVDLYGQPDGAFDGDAVVLQGRHQSRDWFGQLSLTRVEEDFRADAGFMFRVDYQALTGMAARTFWGEQDDWYSFIRMGVQGGRIENLEGELSEQEAQLFAAVSGPMQSEINGFFTRRDEFFAGETFEITGGGFQAEIRPSGAATLGLGGYYGGAVDYRNGRKGTQISIRPQAELKLGRHLNVNLQHAYQRLEYEGRETFVANLSQLRAVYNFNVRTFFRAIVQYQDIDRNVEEYLAAVNPETKTLFTQLLFSYKVNPQTVLFLGYSDNSLGLLTPELTRTELSRQERTFFLKLGYAWRP
jgi:hypothetical protein